jgi:hypothetical protein
MPPEVRRLLSVNGICPVGIGIESKDICERTWKSSGEAGIVAHKDINGVRLGLSAVWPNRIYVTSRNGNMIPKESVMELVKELDEFGDDGRIYGRQVMMEKGFDFKIVPDGVEFNHNGPKWVRVRHLIHLLSSTGDVHY